MSEPIQRPQPRGAAGGGGRGGNHGEEGAATVAARVALLLASDGPLPRVEGALARLRPVVLAEPPVAPRYSPAWRFVPSPRAVALTLAVAAAALLWWSRGSSHYDPVGTTAPDSAAPKSAPNNNAPRTQMEPGAGATLPSLPAATTPPRPTPAATSDAVRSTPALRSAPAPRGTAAPSTSATGTTNTTAPAAARAMATTTATNKPSGAARDAPAAANTVAAPPPAIVTGGPGATAGPIAATPTHDDTSGAELLVQATRHLRHDDDAAGARALVQRYLDEHPGGPLTEEALYLDVEIADALQDGSLARAATRYLQRFPEGRLRSAVIRLRDGR